VYCYDRPTYILSLVRFHIGSWLAALFAVPRLLDSTDWMDINLRTS